jgi:hypothetical protein
MRKLIRAVFLVLLLVTGGLLTGAGSGYADTVGTDRAAAAQVADGLNVLESTATRFRGGFSHGAGIVSFDAKATSPVTSSATITVNGKTFTVERDVKAGMARWSGGGVSLVPEDRSAMLRFDKALVTKLTAPLKDKNVTTIPAHQDLLSRLSALIAEAPLGTAMTKQEVAKPAEATSDTRYTPDGVPTVESCLQDVIKTSEPKTDARTVAVAACQQGNEDSILYFSCAIGGKWLCHDSDSHCFLCETIQAGYGASVDCLGRCGPGCGLPPPTGGHGAYTYDCGDHDRCGQAHGGSANPWDSECGDEYWEADDDFLWAGPNC